MQPRILERPSAANEAVEVVIHKAKRISLRHLERTETFRGVGENDRVGTSRSTVTSLFSTTPLQK